MHLGDRYERERMLAAASERCKLAAPPKRSVIAILKNGLDKVLLPLDSESSAKIAPIQQANLRGAGYYRQSLMEAWACRSHRRSTSSIRWACSAWCSGCASNFSRTST
jgi:hypothetical protein